MARAKAKVVARDRLSSSCGIVVACPDPECGRAGHAVARPGGLLLPAPWAWPAKGASRQGERSHARAGCHTHRAMAAEGHQDQAVANSTMARQVAPPPWSARDFIGGVLNWDRDLEVMDYAQSRKVVYRTPIGLARKWP